MLKLVLHAIEGAPYTPSPYPLQQLINEAWVLEQLIYTWMSRTHITYQEDLHYRLKRLWHRAHNRQVRRSVAAGVAAYRAIGGINQVPKEHVHYAAIVAGLKETPPCE